MGCAVTVKLTEDKKHIEEMHIGYGVAAPTPIRCFKAEEKVKGMEIGNELFETLGKSVLEEVNPRTAGELPRNSVYSSSKRWQNVP